VSASHRSLVSGAGGTGRARIDDAGPPLIAALFPKKARWHENGRRDGLFGFELS
jgi:hypothetical protein